MTGPVANNSAETSQVDPAPTSAPDPNASGDGLESLPTSWQTEIKKLRAEGQSKGQRITALENDLTAVRNEFAQKEADYTKALSESALEQARYRAAVTSGVPADKVDEFASRLRGSTPEELAADASNLAQLFPAAAPAAPQILNGVDPSLGLGNGTQAPVTPGAQLAELVRGQLGRS